MGYRSVNNPFGDSSAHVDNEIGTAFDTVKEVQDNLPMLQEVHDLFVTNQILLKESDLDEIAVADLEDGMAFFIVEANAFYNWNADQQAWDIVSRQFDGPFFAEIEDALATTIPVGGLFYAIAPEGSLSPDTGNSVAGEKRLYRRMGDAPFYEDQGDLAAPVSRSITNDLMERQDEVEETLQNALSASAYRPDPEDGNDLAVGAYFLSRNPDDGDRVWVYLRIADAPGYEPVELSAIEEKLSLQGGTMDGSINMDGNRITNLPLTPAANGDPVTLAFHQLALREWQVMFDGRVIVDPYARTVKYPRMVLMRNGVSFKDLDPATHAGGSGGVFLMSLSTGSTGQVHYLDISKVGTGDTPVLGIAGAASPDLSDTNMVPLGWSLNGSYNCAWSSDIRWLDRGGGEVVFATGAQPILIDRSNVDGGGAMIYAPINNLFVRARGIGVPVQGYINAGNADVGGEFAGYCALALTGMPVASDTSAGTINHLVYDLDANLWRIIAYSSVPGNLAGVGYRYIEVAVITGVWNYSSPVGALIVELGRPTHSSINARGPVIQDGTNLYFPELYYFGRWSRAFTLFEPSSDEFYFDALTISTSTTSQSTFYIDGATLAAGGTPEESLKVATAGAGFKAGYGKGHIRLGSSLNGIVTLEPGLMLAGDNVGGSVGNMFPYSTGAHPEDSRVRLFNDTAPVAISSTYLNALGIVEGWYDPDDLTNRPYVGMDFTETPRIGQIAFFRFYLQADETGEFGNTPNIFIYYPSGYSIVVPKLMKEIEGETYALREYVAWVRIARNDYTYFIAGANTQTLIGDDLAKVKVAGLQYHASDSNAWWIDRNDYPVPALTPDGLIDYDLSPLFTDTIYLLPDSPMTINVPMLFANRQASRAARASFMSKRQNDGGHDMFDIDPARCGTTGVLTVMRDDESTDARINMPVAIGIGEAAAQTPKILCHGDSISNRMTLKHIDDRLTGLGLVPEWIGTFGASADPADRWDDSGPLCEAREGRAFTDLVNSVDDGEATPLPVGQEAIYMALTKSQKLAYNPFLRAENVGVDDPAIVRNGYVFDPRFYLDRFGLDDPTHVLVMLGENDALEWGIAADVKSRIEDALSIIIPQWQAAVPGIKIGFGMSGQAAGDKGDVLWTARKPAAIRAIIETINTLDDDDVTVFPSWTCVNPDGEWATDGVLDPETGEIVGDITDNVHPIGSNCNLLAEMPTAWIVFTA